MLKEGNIEHHSEVIRMINKRYLIFGILLSVVSLILLFIGATSNLVLLIASFIGLLIGIYTLMRWSTVGYKWICDECGESFEITLRQNVFGINSGVNYKSLYCPKCHKKTMCKGVPKQ